MSAPRSDDDWLGRWERPLLAALMVVAALLLLRPLAADPGLAMGAVRSESPRHFWGLWGAAQGLFEWGPFVAHLDLDYPSGYSRHLMDPVNLLFFLPGYWLGGGSVQGATLGWNLLFAAWPVVGGVGGWLLLKRALHGQPGARVAALVGAFACATAPYLMATPWLGRTEMMPGVLWPLHLALLWRGLSADGRPRHLVGAGLALAGVALGGWYLAAWVLLFEPPVALVLARHALRRGALGGWGAQLRRLTVVGVISVLPVLPALWALLAYPPPILGESQRVSVHMGICTPPWLLLPFTGNVGLPGTDLPAYPGTVLTLLGLWGAVRARAARPWLGLAAVMLVLSLGPYLVWSNDAGELMADPARLPAFWVEKLLPPVRFIWGWCRIGVLMTGPLAVAAAFGVADLWTRLRDIRWQLAAMLIAGMALDHGLNRAPAGVRGSTFDPRPPAGFVDALAGLPDGALLQLPFDDHYMTWQLAHGRPVAESLEIEDVRSLSWLVQEAGKVISMARKGEPVPAPTAEAAACAAADGLILEDAGYAAVVLHRDRLPDGHLELTRLIRSGLGEPVVDTGGYAIWRTGGAPPPAGLSCPVADVKPIIPGAERMDEPPPGSAP